MTYEEAKRELVDTLSCIDFADENFANNITRECVIASVNALEKQIAKKPLDKKHFTDFLSVGFCPCCGEGTNEEMKFCCECGQKLDWSE